MRRFFFVALACSTSMVLGCVGGFNDAPLGDAGSARDAGDAVDAGHLDAGHLDAGVPSDAGDAEDAGDLDAGHLDAGVSVDAGGEDGGPPDSGTDGGPQIEADAGSDGGVDAGPECVADEDCTLCAHAIVVTGPADCTCLGCPTPRSVSGCEAASAASSAICVPPAFDYGDCPVPACARPPPVACVSGSCAFVFTPEP